MSPSFKDLTQDKKPPLGSEFELNKNGLHELRSRPCLSSNHKFKRGDKLVYYEESWTKGNLVFLRHKGVEGGIGFLEDGDYFSRMNTPGKERG